MNKLLGFVLLYVFPGLILADNSLNFAPPPTDYSVVFLGNLFGVVDGVLSGTGSQIMGQMFGVFNAAVLALGGIIIMYTLMVSTMNTAHEGQMLGQKWSSIWIPVRSTLGLALLIPKASGYCLMQIFVMWIVIQGVGAADKVWSAALSYLNRGGVIIQAQQINPATSLISGNAGVAGVANGAMTILAGQVCMLGLQTQLQNQRQTYLNAKQNNSGPCSGTPSDAMQQFCNTAVPDFIGSVNAVTVQNNASSASSWTVKMPNFDLDSPYAFLNGICGSIKWNSISSLSSVTNQTNASITGGTNYMVPGNTFGVTSTTKDEVLNNLNNMIGSNTTTGPSDTTNNVSAASSTLAGGSAGGISLSSAELSTAQMSRAIAIQQMYVDLSSMARTIVTNSPGMKSNTNGSSTSTPFSPYADEQFGVPLTLHSTLCPSAASQDASNPCSLWGPAPGATAGTLFGGTEFLNALNDYNSVMMPTLNLLLQMKDVTNANNSRAFITNASTQGWIMAGAYFFDLVKIQGSATLNSSMTDSNTGLENSAFDSTTMLSPFGENSKCTANYTNLCTWFGGNSAPITQVEGMIDGLNPNTKPSTSTNNSQRVPVVGAASSTVYGFVNNSLMVQLPGQPGLKPLTFANTINFNVDTSLYTLKRQNFDCGEVTILFFKFCFGQMMGNLFYNVIFLFIYNTLMEIFGQIINQVVMAFLMVPLTGMATIFQQGVQVLAAPGVNPIVALANMGVQYINFSGNLWMMLLDMAVTSALIPWFGVFIFALMSLAMPLIFAWVGVMTTIGFTTAYYIPILPYMIFTFGALSWLISVIEAMVAAPIVALGVTHPEGHDAFGKGEAAIMILINVFLRPAMMIIGYIAAIALSYVGVWILNAGYDHAISYIQQENTSSTSLGTLQTGLMDSGSGTGGYSDWAGIYAFFFSILTYTSMYLILVQKSFTLISYLPDKVLRWIGGSPESLGQESAQWAGEVQSQQKEGVEKSQAAQAQIEKSLGGYASKAVNKATQGGGQGGGDGGASAQGMGNVADSE